MQVTLKHYADYFSMGLLAGLCSQVEIIRWVDHIIEESNYPEDWMIELSTSANRHPLDVIHLLDIIPGTKDLDISFKLLVAKLGKVYPTLLSHNCRFLQSEHSQVLQKLYRFVRDYCEISDDLRGYIFQIDCDLDCVEQGYGDWLIIQKDYEELLAVGSDYKIWVDDASVK